MGFFIKLINNLLSYWLSSKIPESRLPSGTHNKLIDPTQLISSSVRIIPECCKESFPFLACNCNPGISIVGKPRIKPQPTKK